MSLTISRVTCNKWGQELAALHEDTRSVCEFLNSAVLQTRRGFADGKSYNGGYIRPAPVKQGTFYLYPIEFGEFALTTNCLERQHSLAVMEEVLTKEMLTSYLYEVCAGVAARAAPRYAFAHPDAYNLDRQEKWVSKYQRDVAEYFNTLHIAALREDMQRAASRVPFCEQEMGHARHEKSKIFNQWKYSQELLKRARREINKRGVKVNKLRKEVKELGGVVQHLAKENVRLTDDCSRLQRSIMGGDGLNECGAPLYPSMAEQHERERARVMPAFVLNLQICAQEFAESRKSFEKVVKIHTLKERYKGLRGCGANDKRYQFRKSFQAARKFSQYVCKEHDVMQSVQYRQLHTYDLTLPIGKYFIGTLGCIPQHIIDMGRTLVANLDRTAGIIGCHVEIQATDNHSFCVYAKIRTANHRRFMEYVYVRSETLSEAHKLCEDMYLSLCGLLLT